jgi:hypothetical protein
LQHSREKTIYGRTVLKKDVIKVGPQNVNWIEMVLKMETKTIYKNVSV